MFVPLTRTILERILLDVNEFIAMSHPIPKTEMGWQRIERASYAIVATLKDCDRIPNVDPALVWECIRADTVVEDSHGYIVGPDTRNK